MVMKDQSRGTSRTRVAIATGAVKKDSVGTIDAGVVSGARLHERE